MQRKYQLRLIQGLERQRKNLNATNRAFTLVELMIVVAVIGILSAVALPQYLLARSRAEAGAKIGEAIGLAKECAVGQASKLAGNVVDAAGATQTCDGTANTNFVATWTGNAAGVRCLNQTVAAQTTATITASTTGALTCVLS